MCACTWPIMWLLSLRRACDLPSSSLHEAMKSLWEEEDAKSVSACQQQGCRRWAGLDSGLQLQPSVCFLQQGIPAFGQHLMLSL